MKSKLFSRYIVLLTLLLIIPASIHAIDRRKAQFLDEPGYLIFPLPYSLPGIGEGWILTAMLGNVMDTNVDAYFLGLTGDVKGYIYAISDIHIVPETLILEYFDQRINHVVVNNYASRGMDSDKDDFTLVELSKVKTQIPSATLTLFDRRFELSYTLIMQDVEIPSISDSDGNLIAKLDPPYTEKSEKTNYNMLLDYTDDRQDPRVGARLAITRSNTPSSGLDDPQYNVWDYNATFYIPMGNISTLALNYFRSDAEVTREGETDKDVIRTTLNMGCPPAATECLDAENKLVDMIYAGNKYGNSTPLGGEARLRSYPGGRYSGAHTLFYGAEFRWNFAEESTPFDYFIWKDVRTGSQIALFYETGTVADVKGDLGNIYRSSYGVGFRLVTASGYVYRAELANGDEGMTTIIIFNYPWKSALGR